MLYSWLIFKIFLVCLLGAIGFFYYGIDLMREWLVYRTNRFIVEIFVLLDWVSVLFIGVVFIISSIVILYRVAYMEGDKDLDRFVVLVILFVASILIMILSPRLIRVLFGWDLLGLVSYCLVIYYHNYRSFNSGMVTVLSNRIGDVGLLMAIGLAFRFGRWNIRALERNYIIILLILIAAVTKRAQMPFSSWLLMAIAAPTPVSSLVHSSTLVTAGVYLIIRFNRFIISSGVNWILIFIAVWTMIISGLMANFEFDLKKIIALSTLRQLGFIMIILGVGLKFIALFHLLIHAVFKSLLFICAGRVIHIFGGNQDIRYYGNLSRSLPFLIIRFFVSVLSLVGFPFIAGFYSKDIIIELTYILRINLILEVFIILSISLTVMYSLRISYYLFFRDSKFKSLNWLTEGRLINFSIIILIFLRIGAGSLLNWGFYFDLGGNFLRFDLKFIVIKFFWVGVFVRISFLGIKVGYIKNIVVFVLRIWYLNFFHVFLNKICLHLRAYIVTVDQNWVENVEGSLFFKMKLTLMKIYYSVFKIYDVIFNQVLLILILIVLGTWSFSW